MTTRDELAEALTDVRRAYRLLHGYHRRAHDLFARFDAAMEDAKVPFVESGPANFARMRQKSGKFWDQRWAWDVLPGYGLYATYQRFKPRPLRRVALYIRVDSGYPWGSVEPMPRDFVPVEEAQSVVGVELWTADADQFRGDAWKALRALDSPWDGKTHEVPVEGPAHTYKYVGVDLAEITDDEQFDKLVVAPVLEWLPPVRA